jgi:hypothetical protein
MSDSPAQIVRFWHAVEMFSPQALPPADARNHVVDFRPGDRMPWEAGTKASQGKVWRHEVFAGVYDLSKVRDVLISKYGEDDPEAAPVRGQSALFACTIDADGYLVAAVNRGTVLDRGDGGTPLAMSLTADPGVPRTDVQLNPLVVRRGAV